MTSIMGVRGGEGNWLGKTFDIGGLLLDIGGLGDNMADVATRKRRREGEETWGS